MSQLSRFLISSGPGSGTVTSITFNGGLTSTPDPVVATGVATIDQTNLTVLDGTVYWDTGTQLLHTTATGTAGQVLTSNGVGAAPTYQDAASGTTSFSTDSGTATPSGGVISIEANNAALNAGSSVLFTGGGNAVILNVTDINGNTIIGMGSGNSSINGSTNTGVGSPVFQSLTSGTNNSAFGSGALDSLADASNNSAFGQGALQQLSTGNGENVAIGLDAGFQLTSGASNTLVGFAAGYNYTSSESNNICIGSNQTELAGENNALRIGAGTGTGVSQINQAFISGINSNTQSYNTYPMNVVTINPANDQLGVHEVSDANANTFLGYNSGTLSITGSNNTAIGENSANAITSGSANCFIGFENGLQLTTGSYNTTSGMQSFLFGNGVGNIVIGNNQAAVNYTGAESYNIILGNSPGTASESNVLRIGAATGTDPYSLNAAYICGINGNTLSGTPSFVVIDPSTNQLGVSSGGGGGITTINGDTGSVTGSTVSIKSASTAGSSVSFSGSGTTLSLNTSDSSDNTFIGLGAGNATAVANGAASNACLGWHALTSITSGGANAGIGLQALASCTTGGGNMAVGQNALAFLTAGNYNIGIGNEAGFNYTGAESYNIIFNNGPTDPSVLGESNTLRIGNGTGTGSGQLNAAYICGINGNTVSNTMMVTIDSSTDQLGSQTLPSAGSLILIQTQTIPSGSPVAEIDFTTGITSSYNNYFLTFDNIVIPAATGLANLVLQVSANGGRYV